MEFEELDFERRQLRQLLPTTASGQPAGPDRADIVELTYVALVA